MPNRVRFDGTARRFYEVWYFIFNDPASGDGFWIRYTLLNPLDEHPEAGAALWFAHTCRRDPDRSVAIRRNFAPGDFEARAGTAAVRIGGATFEEGGVRGGFESAGHSVSWDLRYEPSPQPHYYFGDVLRRLSARRTSVTLPNPQIFLSGDVTIDGRPIHVARGPGHQAHHWGVERAPRWLWGHCCAFDDDPAAVLELLAPEPHVPRERPRQLGAKSSFGRPRLLALRSRDRLGPSGRRHPRRSALRPALRLRLAELPHVRLLEYPSRR